MKPLQVDIAGIGLLGPGLPGWGGSVGPLTGGAPFQAVPPVLPPVEALPPAERRRVGVAIRLAMTVGFEAARDAGADPARLPTVFSSTGGDTDNCHAILETLSSADRSLSPTRFQNSVHNAPAGYWSIATRCEAASTSLCSFDATFASALLEAAVQVLSDGGACLLIAYDTPYPEPLVSLRPISHAMGVGLVLRPAAGASPRGRLTIRATGDAPTRLADPGLDSLRGSTPVGRSLPLLRQLAARERGRVVIEYLDPMHLAVEVEP